MRRRASPSKTSSWRLVDADTQAFDAIMAAYGMPKGTDDQKAKRHQAIQDATRNAIDIPMQVAQVAHDGLSLAAAMASDGNPNSVTDAGVGAMCLRTAVLGAVLNARINCGDLEDADYVAQIQSRCAQLVESATHQESEILATVDRVMARIQQVENNDDKKKANLYRLAFS